MGKTDFLSTCKMKRVRAFFSGKPVNERGEEYGQVRKPAGLTYDLDREDYVNHVPLSLPKRRPLSPDVASEALPAAPTLTKSHASPASIAKSSTRNESPGDYEMEPLANMRRGGEGAHPIMTSARSERGAEAAPPVLSSERVTNMKDTNADHAATARQPPAESTPHSPSAYSHVPEMTEDFDHPLPSSSVIAAAPHASESSVVQSNTTAAKAPSEPMVSNSAAASASRSAPTTADSESAPVSSAGHASSSITTDASGSGTDTGSDIRKTATTAEGDADSAAGTVTKAAEAAEEGESGHSGGGVGLNPMAADTDANKTGQKINTGISVAGSVGAAAADSVAPGSGMLVQLGAEGLEKVVDHFDPPTPPPKPPPPPTPTLAVPTTNTSVFANPVESSIQGE